MIFIFRGKEKLKELQKLIKTLSDTEEEHLSQSYIKEKKLEESKYKRSDSRTDDEDDSDRITIPSTCLSVRNDLRAMSGLCRNIVLDLGKCVIFTLELNECFEGGPLLSKVKSHCLRIFDAYCKGEDHVGVAAYTVRGDQTLRLSKKELHGQYQRKMLDVATTSTSEMVSPSLPYAMQMTVDSSATTEKDTYILLMTDGYSWDVEGYRDIKHQIEKFNRERMTSIHLLILGLDIEDDEIVNECRALSAITKSSMFLEISLDNVDAAFASVISTINALQLTEPSIVGITMEKF